MSIQLLKTSGDFLWCFLSLWIYWGVYHITHLKLRSCSNPDTESCELPHSCVPVPGIPHTPHPPPPKWTLWQLISLCSVQVTGEECLISENSWCLIELELCWVHEVEHQKCISWSHLCNCTPRAQTKCVTEMMGVKQKAVSVWQSKRAMTSTPPTSIHVQREGEVKQLKA